MDVDQPEPYTLLRIKRKRNEEPLEALVVEAATRRKKSRGAIDIFQFAKTVEDDAWKDQVRQKALQDEITRIRKEAPVPPVAVTQPSPPSPLKNKSVDPGRRYTVVHNEAQVPDPNPVNTPSQELPAPATAADFKLLDAVREDTTVDRETLDPDMQKIQDLLMEYLHMDKDEEVKLVPNSMPDDEDYVWDVFYRQTGPMKTLPSTGIIGTLSSLPSNMMYESDSDDSAPEDEADEDSNAEDNYRNDYPDEEESEDDSSDEFHDGYATDSDGVSDHADTGWR